MKMMLGIPGDLARALGLVGPIRGPAGGDPFTGLGRETFVLMVPPAGLEPALREEADFESAASTSSAREATSGGGTMSSSSASTLPHGRRYAQWTAWEIVNGTMFKNPGTVPPIEVYEQAIVLTEILDAIRMPFDWAVTAKWDERGYWYLQVACEDGIDSVTGESLSWTGRKWHLSPHMTLGEIVQTVFKALMTAVEHETREQFTYKGRAIFDPHYDIEKLVELRAEPSAVKGRIG